MTVFFLVLWVCLKGVVRDGSFRGVLDLFEGRSSLPPHSSGCCLSLVTDPPPPPPALPPKHVIVGGGVGGGYSGTVYPSTTIIHISLTLSHSFASGECFASSLPNTGHQSNISNKTAPPKSRQVSYISFFTVQLLFCSLKNGINAKIRMLCFVIVNSVLLNLSCVCIKYILIKGFRPDITVMVDWA